MEKKLTLEEVQHEFHKEVMQVMYDFQERLVADKWENADLQEKVEKLEKSEKKWKEKYKELEQFIIDYDKKIYEEFKNKGEKQS